MRNITDLIDELKRRRVFRVLIAYAVTAFVIIQIADIVFPALHLPEWTLTLVVVLIGIGFPIVFGLAWAFDLTDKGVVKTPRGAKPTEGSVKSHPIFSNKTLAVITAIAIIIAGWGLIKSLLTREGATQLVDKSVAVLPFTPFTISEENQGFADGVHDDILTQLSKIKALKVISRTSVVQYKNTTKTIRQIADELNVANILEGSVRRAGNQIRIVAQLINADTDNHIWSETYDRDYADIFAIQSDVAKQIAAALKATLTPEEKNYIDEIPTDNLEAYDYFLKGKHYWNTYATKAGNQKAVDMFDKATELDPDFAMAYAWASIVHSALYCEVSWDYTPERKELARSTLEQAIALDPDHPTAHFAKGSYQYWCLYDFNSALKEFEIAFKGEPNNGEIIKFLGQTHQQLGNWEQAEKAFLKAIDLDPMSFLNLRDAGYFYAYQRQYQESNHYLDLATQVDPEQATVSRRWALNHLEGFGDIEKARSMLKEAELAVKDPAFLLWGQYLTEIYARNYDKALSYAKEFDWVSLALGETYYLLGQDDLAQEEFDSLRIYYEEKIREEPANSYFHGSLGLVYAYLGLKEKAILEGERMIDLPTVTSYQFRWNSRRYLAIIYTLTGEQELAIDNLEYLLSIPSLTTKWMLRLDPIYDPLRDNPRFQKLITEN